MTPIKAASGEVSREALARIIEPFAFDRREYYARINISEPFGIKETIDSAFRRADEILARFAPAGNDRVREAAKKAVKLFNTPNADAFYPAMEALAIALSLPQAREAGEPWPEPYETPFSVRYSGIQDAKGRYVAELSNPYGTVVRDAMAQSIVNVMNTASPPPIPDAAVGREAIIDQCAEEANAIDPEILKGMREDRVSLYCQSRVDAVNAILALKPQDTGSEK